MVDLAQLPKRSKNNTSFHSDGRTGTRLRYHTSHSCRRKRAPDGRTKRRHQKAHPRTAPHYISPECVLPVWYMRKIVKNYASLTEKDRKRVSGVSYRPVRATLAEPVDLPPMKGPKAAAPPPVILGSRYLGLHYSRTLRQPEGQIMCTVEKKVEETTK